MHHYTIKVNGKAIWKGSDSRAAQNALARIRRNHEGETVKLLTVPVTR